MTSAIPAIPAQPKRAKRTKTNLATVSLPKCKYELLDEATRERKEEMAQKAAVEEAKKSYPDTNTKPDIFLSSSFLSDDKIIIVNYPKNKKEKREKRDKDINDAYNALNGTKNDNSTQDMPQGAIDALEKLLGKVPDQQKTRGSNYGRLAQDFTFPSKQQSTAGKSKETNEEETAASSSKSYEDEREADLEDLDKKERARRRKSNLNALAPSFTPSFASSGSSTDQNKSVDSDSRIEVEDRKKKNKKEKAVIDVNGDIESPTYQRKPKKSSQQILPSELSAIDTTTGSYGSYVTNSFEPAFFMPAAPPTPFPVQFVENSPPNWEEFQKNLSTEVVSRVEMQVQKHIEKLVSEVRTTLVETRPEYTNSSSSVSDKGKDDTVRLFEETERKNEENRFNKMQEELLQELQNYQHDILSSHEELMLRHEEVQTRHFQLQAEVQSTSVVQRRHVELQNMLQKELSQLDELKTRLQEMQSEHRKMQDRQQQLHDEMTDSQTLRRRLGEFDGEIAQLRFKNNQLTEENTLLRNEIAKLSEESKVKERKQDTFILELQNRERQLQSENIILKNKFSNNESELNLVRNKNKQVELSLEEQIQKFRTLQNENQKLFEENTATKNSHQSNISELKSKLRQAENELAESRRKYEFDINTWKSNEENLRAELQDTARQLDDVRDYHSLKKVQEKLESERNELLRINRELQTQPRNLENETIQTIQNELAAHRTCKKSLENRVSELSKVRQELEKEVAELVELRPRIKELEKQASDLERSCLKMKELETHSVELDHYRRRTHELETEIKNLRQHGRDSENHANQIENLQQMCHDLEEKFDNTNSEVIQLRHNNSELKKEASAKAEEVKLRTSELNQARGINQSLQNRTIEIVNELSDLRMRLREIEAEKNRLQMNAASTSTISYNSPMHTPRITNSDNILDERRISRDQMLYSNPSIPNNLSNFESSNYNRIKPQNTPNTYSQQTFSPLNNNMSSQSLQSSQPMQIMTSGINLQHSQASQYSPNHFSSTNHLQYNQPPQEVQSVVPLQQFSHIPPVVQLPHSHHLLHSAQQQKMTQQMQTHSQLPPLVTMQSYSTNVSALPSPTTSQQGSQSHPTQQKNGKAHSRNSSNNLGNNHPKQSKQKSNRKKQKNASGSQHKGVNDTVANNANNANNPQTNATDSNALRNPWNKSELNN
ncbi:4101_t:CDS:2, partial [Funneliformis caledonium]